MFCDEEAVCAFCSVFGVSTSLVSVTFLLSVLAVFVAASFLFTVEFDVTFSAVFVSSTLASVLTELFNVEGGGLLHFARMLGKAKLIAQ